jgi:hypothetical protein
MTPLEKLDDVMTPEQLLADLKEDILVLTKKEIDEDIDEERIQELLKVRKVHLYHQGKQYVSYRMDGEYLDIVSATGTPLGQEDDDEDDVYDYIINICKGDMRKFIAVVGNRPPNVAAEGDYPEDDESLENARNAESLSKTLFSWWNVKQQHRYLTKKLWDSGTVFGYTPFAVDGSKYGTTQEPKWTTQQQEMQPAGFECPQCAQRYPGPVCESCGLGLTQLDYREADVANVPVQDGFETYENGRVELHLYTILEVAIPFHAREFGDVPYLKLEVEEHKAKMIEIYPDLEELLKDDSDKEENTSSQSHAISIRQSDSSPNGSQPTRKNMVTYGRYWLRPYMYNLIKDKEKREKCRTYYPDGMKVVRVKDHVVEIRNESMDKLWSYCTPEATDYIYGEPLSIDHVQIQDLVNDLINIGVETMERAIPWMLADPNVVDFQQLRSRARRPAEVVPTIPGAGQSLHSAIKEAPIAAFSGQTMPFASSIHETVREIAGVQRVIFGGEDQGDRTTARQYEGQRNQAMMQLTTVWDCIRTFYENTLKNGTRQLAEFGPRLIGDPENPQRLLDIQKLVDEDNWHFTVEETIPITPGQKADRLMYLFGQANPAVLGVFGLTHPQNAPLINDTMGMEGLYIPGSDALEAIKTIIRRLLQEEPIVTMGPDGQPTELPSIEPTWAEDPAIVVAAIKAWALTKPGLYAADNNPAGYSNVIAYGKMHEQKLVMAQMAQAQMGEPPAGPPGSEGPEGGQKGPDNAIAPTQGPMGPMPQGQAPGGQPMPMAA